MTQVWGTDACGGDDYEEGSGHGLAATTKTTTTTHHAATTTTTMARDTDSSADDDEEGAGTDSLGNDNK